MMNRGKPEPGSVPGRELAWMLLEYLMVWPFMCHVGLVLFVAWVASCLHGNVVFISILGFIYLYQIETRQKEKLLRRIRHEERKSASKLKLSEGETVRWMNQALETVWPLFVENFASQVLLLPMSWFLNRYKPWTAKKAFIQHLSLGKVPPVITMIRTLEQPVDGDDLAVEATLEFLAAKDMSAVLGIQVRRRVGLGLWTTFHISNLHIEGKVKIGIKFVKGWPLIGRIRICFATAPFLQITAHPLFSYGVDVAELPGIAQWLDRLMTDALAESLVEPNFLVIDVERLLRDAMGPLGLCQQPKPAEWFTMQESPPLAWVTVEVLEAANLRVGDINGSSDPFVKGSLGLKEFTTKIKWKTLNPKWNESFKLPITSWEHPNLLLLKVRDKDRIYDDDLGFCVVEISQYRDGNRQDFWLQLLEVSTGKIHLAVTVNEKPNESHSSDEVSNTSTTFETAPQASQEILRNAPVGGLPVPTSLGGVTSPQSPSDSLSSRLRSRRASGKALAIDGTPVESRRSRSFFGSRSQKMSEVQPVSLDSRKATIVGDDVSSVDTSGEISRLSALSGSTQTGTEGKSVPGEESEFFIDVGFGELGSVSICQLGDAPPAKWPKQKHTAQQAEELLKWRQCLHKASDQQSISDPESLTNTDEDGGPARKLRSAGLRMQNMLHRRGRGNEKDSPETPSPDERYGREHEKDAPDSPVRSERCQDFSLPSDHVSAASNGTMVHVSLEPTDGHTPLDIAPSGIQVGHETGDVAPFSDGQGGEDIDSVGSGSDSERRPLHLKAKGLMNMAGKAANHLGHQLSRRMRKHKEKERPPSSEEQTTSGELTQDPRHVGHVSEDPQLKADEKFSKGWRKGNSSLLKQDMVSSANENVVTSPKNETSSQDKRAVTMHAVPLKAVEVPEARSSFEPDKLNQSGPPHSPPFFLSEPPNRPPPALPHSVTPDSVQSHPVNISPIVEGDEQRPVSPIFTQADVVRDSCVPDGNISMQPQDVP